MGKGAFPVSKKAAVDMTTNETKVKEKTLPWEKRSKISKQVVFLAVILKAFPFFFAMLRYGLFKTNNRCILKAVSSLKAQQKLTFQESSTPLY